ncbi:hypothetical protein [Paenibacillus agilis]|uniref:Uncharacterized protein n=1 Tax=Paenibacillus agilis TaxID=3020863 RepID=A0A559J0E0_9BACL|nr:hypothetical protein [Paenibacillus agilis]TVX93352.1 hypothetical protein FPZ44_09995 [Paenibacillus agilis]
MDDKWLGFLVSFGFLFSIMALLFYFVYAKYSSKHLKKASASMIDRDEDYRKLLENFTRLQQELKAGQEKLLAEQFQINRRVTSIEKVLKEVD